MLRADQPGRRLGRRGDPRLRHRVLGRARGQARARHARHVGQALHHAGAGRDAARPRVPRRTIPTSSSASKEDLGITCALIPTTHPGVHIGRRHMPLNAVFQNGPNSGSDVFIPMDWIIGGQPMIGKGWRMLMECLAAGRAHLAAVVEHAAGQARGARRRRLRARAHAVQDADRQVRGRRGAARAHRRQPVHDGRDAHADGRARSTSGEKPAVLSAIAKYHITERGAADRSTTAWTSIGGKGICMGPRTSSAARTCSIPVAITVEGANILTRSLIIFGQGAIRCHPYRAEGDGRDARRRDSARGVGRVRRGAVGPRPLRAVATSRARW